MGDELKRKKHRFIESNIWDTCSVCGLPSDERNVHNPADLCERAERIAHVAHQYYYGPKSPDPQDIKDLAALLERELSALRESVIEEVILALCPTCNPEHTLDNGRVWGFCRARYLIGKRFTEEEIWTAIRNLKTPAFSAPNPKEPK
jgi:hypothetical protein